MFAFHPKPTLPFGGAPEVNASLGGFHVQTSETSDYLMICLGGGIFLKSLALSYRVAEGGS